MRSSPLVAAAGALLVMGGLLAVPAPGAALGSSVHASVPKPSPAYNWAEFHDGPTLRGYASNSPLSTANASHLGVAWATDLYGAAVDSPAVAYDATLRQMLDYIGTENGNMIAVNAANGHIVWSNWLGSAIRTSPTVIAGSVWVGTFNSARIYKLNANTGAVQCSTAVPEQIEGTPLAATPPGGIPSVYFGTLDSTTAEGPTLAINAANCATEWSFTGYAAPAGSWDPLAYAVDATHQPLLVFGTDDPDSTVYALNAVTGTEVWRFRPAQPPGDYDVGAGVTISPPGVDGFADGVAYAHTKFGIVYALNLTTGAKIWSNSFTAKHNQEGGLSTAALARRNLVLGYLGGLVDLDPVTGALRWTYDDPGRLEIASSPAIAGRGGSQIVAVGDLAGGVDVVSLATGAQLYHYQTASYITASPAISDGNIVLASANGFLYDFAVGGGNGAGPSTTVTVPADSSTVANPNGDITIKGAAADSAGVAEVVVAVQSAGPDGPWWDARSRSWVSGPIGNRADVAARGATSSRWTFPYRVPPTGGTYEVTAYAVASSGQSDVAGAYTGFAVRATATAPYLTATPAFVAPGSGLSVTGGGFAHSEPITVSLLGTTLASTTTTAAGRIPITRVVIPSTTVFGQTSLTARGRTSGKTATAAVTIANSWDELGDVASHTGFEPNDPTFYNSIGPGEDVFLEPAWRYQFGASIDTAPAVTDGVAYAGTAAGQLAAIDVHNGAPLWTWNLPAGAAIAGSPAVDPSTGLVLVGADNGTLDAIRIRTGKLAWSDSIGGDVSAPVYGDGKVYVTSNNRTIEAVAESTGARLWVATFRGRITAAPSLDTASDTLVVGDADGRVAALSAASGARKWVRTLGGAVSATAMISGATVYVASGDSLDAVRLSTGAAVWSYKTSGPITDTPALTGKGQLIVGSGNGNLYELAMSNGSLVWVLPIHHPIVGVATVDSVVIFDTSSGLIGAARSWTSRERMWNFQTSAGITSPAAIIDSTVYVGAGDGDLYAFTTYGHLPH